MKILTIIGARPQFIKAATISRVIKEKYSNVITEIIIHTGQHYENNMSQIFFDEMDIPEPDYNLAINGKSHGAMTGEMLIKLEEIMIDEKPDIILVYGDTNSTLAAALSAVKLLIPIAHIEAGMRSYNKNMPEEINRIITDHVSKYLFCPTDLSAENLKKEGVKDNIYVVGDVMYDAVLYYKAKIKSSEITKNIPKDFYLATCHRQENTDNEQNLTEIFASLDEIAKNNPVVLPLHPRTKKYLEEYKINIENLHIIEPVGYFDMLYLLQNTKTVLTDSGGLQKEAYYFKKPVIIMRDETEWLELIENGIGILTGANKTKILSAVKKLSSVNYFKENIYGAGNSAERIIAQLL